MTQFQRRLFIFADEWLGAGLLLYLHKTHDPAFWPAFVGWFITVYILSYGGYWLQNLRERRQKP